jgi:hypothetical protein
VEPAAGTIASAVPVMAQSYQSGATIPRADRFSPTRHPRDRLVRTGRVDDSAGPAPVDPPPEDYGAEDGWSFRWPDGLLTTVYEFSDYDAATVASGETSDQSAVNGALLLVVGSSGGGSGRVSPVLSYSAGEE